MQILGIVSKKVGPQSGCPGFPPTHHLQDFPGFPQRWVSRIASSPELPQRWVSRIYCIHGPKKWVSRISWVSRIFLQDCPGFPEKVGVQDLPRIYQDLRPGFSQMNLHTEHPRSSPDCQTLVIRCMRRCARFQDRGGASELFVRRCRA
jgi:hypothetical protein